MIRGLILTLSLLSLTAAGTEFFVSPGGSNGNRGTSADQPYKTLKRAVDMMKPGDTLTLLPGEYHQGLEWNFEGGDAVTTIRAAIPGSVVLRGDVDAPEFERSEFSPRVWQCAFPQLPEAVNERDTLRNYQRMPSTAELDFSPGSWFYDEKAEILYINTSDSAPPKQHHITISDLRSHGIMINAKGGVRNVTVEGLILTGFNANSPGGTPGQNAKWGVYMVAPKNCTVRNVTTFLNGSGIGFSMNSSGNAIENCRSYANYSPFYGSGGNIIVLTPSENTAIRNCLSFDSKTAGIRFYGSSPAQNCIFEDNISFDNGYGDMWLKYPSDTTTARRCVAGAALYSRLIENCIFNYGDAGYFGAAKNSIVRPHEKDLDEDREFADPANYDYRPQADSKYRDRSPAPFSDQVFYVKPDGDDKADGNSERTAWRTFDHKIKNGTTFYLLPGTWKNDLVLKNVKDVTIRGRGSFPVALNGRIRLENSENITLERLAATALEVTNSNHITINQCAISGAAGFTGSTKYRLTHNILNGAELSGCTDGFITGNIFASGTLTADNCWSDFNSYSENVPANEPHSFVAVPEFAQSLTLKNGKSFEGRGIDGMPVGPYRRQPLAMPLELDGPKLLSRTATTANIEFWSNYPVNGTIAYGDTPACTQKYDFQPRTAFQSLSLTGLTPGKEHYFRITARAVAGKQFSNQELPQELNRQSRSIVTPVQNFTTEANDRAPLTYHVAVNGSDRNPGSAESPWRTISHAAAAATAGDTVLVHQGTYQESVRIRATGDKDRILNIATAPGEKVWLDGNVRQLDYGFAVCNKKYVQIDGFYFREIHQTEGTAGVVLWNTAHITLSRCFYDGRSDGYTPPFVAANRSANLTLANCFLTRAFHGSSFTNCPDLLIRNCVFYINQVNSCTISNTPAEKAMIRNSIWVDNTLQKVSNPIISLTDIAALDEQDNCYFLRVPENEKTIFGYRRYNGTDLPMSGGGEVLERQWRKQGRFGNEMVTYDAFLKRTNRNGTAIFADPVFKALPNFIRFKNLEDWEQNYAKLGAQHQEQEYHKRGGNFAPLDFPDFLTNNPELQKRKIGLEPEAFSPPGH